MRVLLLLLSFTIPVCLFAQQGTTMQAIQLQEFGGPEVLQIREIPRPDPGVGELLVRVRAAAVNPVDTGIRSGGASGLSGAMLP